MPTNSIAFAKKYTGILDEVYQRGSLSSCLTSGRRMVRAGRNAKEIMVPKISVTGHGDYTRNMGYKSGAIMWATLTITPRFLEGFGYASCDSMT